MLNKKLMKLIRSERLTEIANSQDLQLIMKIFDRRSSRWKLWKKESYALPLRIVNLQWKTADEWGRVWASWPSFSLLFLVNFAVIIGTGTKFGVNLVKEAKKVHQTTLTVPAKRGTIYDRNGTPIAEDATSYNVYAVIDKEYKSANGDVLYVEESQYNKVAEIFHKYLDMEETYVKDQLSQPNLKQVSFGAKGNGITYANMMSIKQDFRIC